jgi:WD40 repeat protein
MRPFRWINDLFLISNLVNGVDRYEISAASAALHQQQSFKHSIRSNVPLHVASALQGRWIICGSDDGSVRIFDQRTEAIIKSLRHSDSKLSCFLVFPTPQTHISLFSRNFGSGGGGLFISFSYCFE